MSAPYDNVTLCMVCSSEQDDDDEVHRYAPGVDWPTDLMIALHAVDMAARGDSNDEEIDALNEALGLALNAAGVG